MTNRLNISIDKPSELVETIRRRAAMFGMTTTAYVRHCLVKELERLEELEVRKNETRNR